MATYKVIQDIEAEDKLVGPLTLRQFIYAGVSAVALYICFLAYTGHATFLLAVFLPIAAASGFFAFPWSAAPSVHNLCRAAQPNRTQASRAGA